MFSFLKAASGKEELEGCFFFFFLVFLYLFAH